MPGNPFPELDPYRPGDRPRKPRTPRASQSWLDREMREERDKQLRSTIIAAPPPEQVARTTRIAREADLPPASVLGSEDSFERALQANRVGALARYDPAFGRFVAQNPRGAAAAQDDTESLGLLGNAWEGLKNVGNRLLAGTADSTAGLIESLGSMSWHPDANIQLAGKILAPLGGMAADALRDEGTRFREAGRADSWVADAALSGVETIPIAAAAAFTRNPRLATAIPALSVFGNSRAEARKQGLSEAGANIYGAAQGGVEYATERLPMGLLVDAVAKRTPFGKAFVRQLAAELPGEQVATVLQDLTDWAMLPENENKTFSDYLAARPGAAVQTAIATVSGTAGQTALAKSAQTTIEASVKLADRVGQARQARREQQFLDDATKAAEGSKLRQRDPEAFRALLREQAQEAGATSLFVPADAVREYQQSDGYDQRQDPFAKYDVEEASLAGGDVVVPIEDALTDIVGTPAWEAVRDQVRLTPGGMSAREAQAFEDGLNDTMAELSDGLRQSGQETDAAPETRGKLVDRVAKMFGVSFTAPAARDIAELAVQRMETRAARLGRELSESDLDGLEVRQVMPEGVAEAVKADQLDLVINALRAGKPVEEGVGPSLLEFIGQRGGINDAGGDLRSMGVANKLLRDFDPSQAELTGGLSGQGDFGIDTTLRAAIEAGYFPDLAAVEDEAGPSMLDTQRLLDAIGEEVAGRPVYAETRTDPVRAAADDLRAMLEDAGLSPDEMTDTEIREAVEGMAEQDDAGRALTQSDMSDAPRGRIVFDQNKRIIELFQSRNLSTPLHELSHMWLEELRFDAETMENPQVFADWETAKAWFKQNGHPLGDDGQIPTEAHELWARAGERYLMEGKAPTAGLKRLFETFRQWLVNIYRTVDRLRAPITPEIREVFDRLLATDDQIAAARETQALSALFTEAADLMSEPEFRAYRDQVENARADAHSTLLDKTMRTIRRREQDRYRDARKAIRKEEQERIDASPFFRAIAAIREQRISKQWIADEMGLDTLELLPVRVPPLYAEGGVDPGIIAEQVGYSGARDMIEALIGAERAHRQAKEGGDARSMRERAIETATDEEFRRRYGDPFNDGSIEREALAAVHSEMQGEVIASELRILSRKAGRRPTPYRIAREWARGKVRSGIVAEEASPGALQRYARNAAKAGRAAEQAMLAGDVDETFRQKQFQMMNNALLAEAKAAADEVQAAVKRMDKIARAKTRKSVDQDYLEQAQSLLEAVDLRRRSQVGIERQGKWEAWAGSREAEGFDVVVPGSFEATIGQTNWSRLSVENLLALDETVKQVIHLGRLKQTLLDNEERREWDEIYREVEAGADNIGRKPPRGSFVEPSWWDSIKSRAATVDAALLKMEQVFDWLDQGKSTGAFNRIVFQPIAAAQAREQDMTRDYFAQVREALESVPAETLRHWGDKVALDLIDPATGLPAVFERKKLVAMALNWGNAGNRQRLADGYGWSAAGIERALMDNLTEPEWRFVQRTWDIIDTLWPEIEKMERAVNGVAPEKVEAVEVVTPFGTMRGGYYPAIYDETLDYTAEEQAGRKTDLFEAKYVRASTRASATKSREEQVSRPILLDVGVISRHLGEVIHDVTHREAVMQAHKFLTNRRVMKAVDETLGPEVRKKFRPWLQHVANSWAQDRAGNEGLGKAMSKVRANVTVVGMGWRFTTMLTQAAGYSNSFEAVGAKWVSAAIAQASAHPVETFDFVMERSGEMRGRMDTLDRDIRAEMLRLESRVGAAGSALTGAKRFAFHGIGYMDRVVTIPTWLGAYNKAITQGLTEQEAAYAGDKAIRLSQGAAGPKDLAAVATGQGRFGEAFKWLTMFYSYLSAVYSRQRNLGRDVRRASVKDVPALMARAWWLIVVPPLLAEILSGRGPEEDEDWAWWAFKKMLSQSLGAIPGVRDAVEPAIAKFTGEWSFGYRLSPLQSVGDAFVRSAGDAGRIYRGEDTTRATRNALEAVGYFTGLVPGQLAASTQFLVDVGAGEADPETISDWYTGLTKGRLPED